MLSWSRAFECIISCFVMVFFSLQSELHLNPPTLTPQTRRWPGSDVTPPPATTSAMDFFLSKTWSKRMFYLKSVPKAVLSTIDKGKSSHVRFFWKSRVPYWTTDFVKSSRNLAQWWPSKSFACASDWSNHQSAYPAALGYAPLSLRWLL